MTRQVAGLFYYNTKMKPTIERIVNVVKPYFTEEQVVPQLITTHLKPDGFSPRGKAALARFRDEYLNVALIDFDDDIYVRYELINSEVAGKRLPAGTVILELLQNAPCTLELNQLVELSDALTKSCGLELFASASANGTFTILDVNYLNIK